MLYRAETLEKIKNTLIERKHTLAVAESVTAGHLQAAFSSAIEASTFFQGGITAYNVGQKCRHLNVDPIIGADTDCVTEGIAQKMALAVTAMFTADYGVAITGYAAKMPEKGLNSLYAYLAIARADKILLSAKIYTDSERVEAQVDYANQVISKFWEVLEKE